MLSHELAAILLASPNLPIATHANNHTYMSGVDAVSHGKLKVGLLHTYGEDHIIVGNISKRNINGENWHITDMIHGDAPEEWYSPNKK
jgi:hypothetical protein